MSEEFPPLSEERARTRIRWYRSKLDPPVLRELTTRSDAKGMLQALGHLGLYLCTAGLTIWAWSAGAWILCFVGGWMHGVVAGFMRGVPTHELAHGTVFRTKWLNRLFLNLFSILTWWNHYDYALSHTYHHRYTLHPRVDREVLLPLRPVPKPFSLIQLMTINLFSPPGRTFSSGGLVPTVFRNLRRAIGLPHGTAAPSGAWIRALHEDQPAEARKSAWWSRALLAFHAAIAAVGVLTGYWILPLVITVAPFTAGIVLYLVSLPQHCGLRDNDPDFRKCARSIRLGPVLTFLYWHMNWHAEHHMYAAVPCYRLRELATIIAPDMPEPKTLPAAWREMRNTWKRQKTEPTYQLDLPLPPTARRAGKVEGTQSPPQGDQGGLADSVGDLAPESLS